MKPGHHVVATIERIGPRALVAVVSLAAAASLGPGTFGVYSMATLVLTLAQSLTDGGLRQVLPQLLTSSDGGDFLRRYRIWVALVSGVVLVPAFAALGTRSENQSASFAMLSLMPLALVPSVTSLGAKAVGTLQLGGRWPQLATNQLVGSAAGAGIGLTALALTHSVFGPSLAVLTAEAIAAALNVAAARHDSLANKMSREKFNVREYWTFALYSGLGWTQAQADRVLIGGIAGATALGHFTLASTLGRSAGDAVAAASANLVRAEDRVTETQQLDRILVRGLRLAAIGAFASSVIAILVVVPWLGPEWADIEGVVPIVAVASIPSVLNWSAAALHARRGTSGRAIIGPLVGLALAVPIGFVAVHSLTLAATLVVLREMAVCTTAFMLLGHKHHLRPLAVCLGVTTASLAVALVWAGSL